MVEEAQTANRGSPNSRSGDSESGNFGSENFGSEDPGSGDSDLVGAVDAARVGVLFQKGPVALATVLINSALLGWLVSGAIAPLGAFGWVGLLWLVSIARALLNVAYRRNADLHSPRMWERRFAIGSTANGIVWGAGSAVFVTGDLPTTVAVVFVAGGMVAGASSSNATSQPSFLGFAVPALAPLVVRLFIAGDATHMIMATMLGLFGVAMTLLARQEGRALITASELQLKNARLAKELERRSQERSVRLRMLMDQAGIVVIVADPKTLRIVDIGENALEMFGRTGDELLGRQLTELGPVLSLRTEEEWEGAIRRARREGEQTLGGLADFDGLPYVELSLSVQPVGDETFLLLVLKDVTERRELERHLAQTSLLASLGTLAAGVAHEVNNPLAFMLNNLEHIREQLTSNHAESPGLADAIDETIIGTKRIQRIVQDLTNTAHPRPENDGLADIAHVVESCLSVADAEIRHRAEVVCELDDVPPVRADPLRLTQVMLNLVLNAAQSIPEGDVGQNRITITAAHDPNDDRVIIRVTDTGCGIPKEQRSRIFDPFYTSKAPGNGTGLGLAVCHAIVTSLDGRLSVESEVGVGSTFSVALRPGSWAAEAGSERRSQPRPSTPPRRVLLIDDDQHVAKSLRRILQSHDVTISRSGREAFELGNLPRLFDVILCDLMMPEMTGADFYREFAARYPQETHRIVFMTGGAFTESTQNFIREIENPVVSKPFDVEQLRSLLAAPRTPSKDLRASSAPSA
ncbi:MAG: ATP-binding protein [Myxococcota bacterium]